jgi:hypothetical protein
LATGQLPPLDAFPDVESRPTSLAGHLSLKTTMWPSTRWIDNAEDGFTTEEIVKEIYPPCRWIERAES